MTRTLFGLILLANLGFFAFIKWGYLLTQPEADSQQLEKPLNADKIDLLGFSSSKPPAAVSAPPSRGDGTTAGAADRRPCSRSRRRC